VNHLAHFLLAPEDDQARAGTLLGDFVRGADLGTWPEPVEQAIRLHRRIDSHTDSHEAVRAARAAAPADLRRYAGILLDVWFDHHLIATWKRWSDTPLDSYAGDAHASLARCATFMPEPAATVAANLSRYRGLTACATPDGMARVLQRIGRRLKKPVALDQGLPHLMRHEALLAEAFETLFPDLRRVAADYLAGSSLRMRPSPLSVSR
jgi:acyl carrier protein phosphodiesterase